MLLEELLLVDAENAASAIEGSDSKKRQNHHAAIAKRGPKDDLGVGVTVTLSPGLRLVIQELSEGSLSDLSWNRD
jgi:hypothetical protein